LAGRFVIGLDELRMLAFIDSPIQIAVVMIVILLVFGPEKMKDIGKQLGRAIREVRRAGSDFRSTLEGEDTRYDSDYKPHHYDNYDNGDYSSDFSGQSNTPAVPEAEAQPAITAGPTAQEPEYRGDFASAALGDTSEYPIDYSAPPQSPQSPASGPVYGVLSTPEQSVPREKSTASKV
jgi:sec-independent protein translocase protein TatA